MSAATIVLTSTSLANNNEQLNHACQNTTGPGGVYISDDNGLSLSAPHIPLTKNTIASSIATLDEKTLMLSRDNSLFVSTDAGCLWQHIGIKAEPMHFTPTYHQTTYAYAALSNKLMRLNGTQVLSIPSPLPANERVAAMTIDKDNPAHATLISHSSTVFYTEDGGQTWHQSANQASGMRHLSSAAFNPNNSQHLIAAAGPDGLMISHDGGKTWPLRAQGLPKSSITHTVVFSRVNSNIVWTAVIAETSGQRKRSLYVSEDGGLNFKHVINESNQVILTNQPTLLPHPTKANVVIHTFGMAFQGYGLDINVIDYQAPGKIQHAHHDELHGAQALGFLPGSNRLFIAPDRH